MASVVERASLAVRGLFRCDGGGKDGKGCHRIRPLKDGIVVMYRGNVVLGACRECFGVDELVISRNERGIMTQVRTRKPSIILASSLDGIRSVADALISPFLKKRG